MYHYINANDLTDPNQQNSNMSRTYKDSVFRKLFNNKENALALYNALTGQNLPKRRRLSCQDQNLLCCIMAHKICRSISS